MGKHNHTKKKTHHHHKKKHHHKNGTKKSLFAVKIPSPIKTYLNASKWEEIREVMSPVFPFRGITTNSSDNYTLPNPFFYVPNSIPMFGALLICLIALIVIIMIYGCKNWWALRYQRLGYTQAPSKDISEKDDPADKVIAEVVNRREQTPAAKSSTLKPQESSASVKPPPSAANSQQSAKSQNPLTPSKSTTQSQVTKNKQATQNTNYYSNPVMMTKLGSDGLEFPETNDYLQSYFHKLQNSATCPLTEPQKINLVPHENLIIPKGYPDVQKIHMPYSNSKNVKTSIQEQIRYLESVMQEENSPFHQDKQRAEPIRKGQLLTPEQKQEERDKFLKACQKNENRRRRSLCSISSNEDLVNAELYNSILNRYENVRAKKVQSMPSMQVRPFGILNKSHINSEYSTDALAESPVWSPLVLGAAALGNVTPPYHPSSGSSSMTSLNNEWQSDLILPSVKLCTLPEQATVNTSKTSIWSTVASENVYDMESEEETSRELAKRTDASNNTTFSTSFNNEKLSSTTVGNERNGTSKTKASIGTKSATNLARKPSLTLAETIIQSAKSKGFISDENKSNISMGLESDQLPSNMFIKSNNGTVAAKSSDSIGSSITSLIDPAKRNNQFWKHQKINEFDPYSVKPP